VYYLFVTTARQYNTWQQICRSFQQNTETNSNKFKQALNFSVQLDECIDRMALETVFVGYPY